MRAALAIAISTLAGCATTSVKTDYDHRADFTRYRTYAIRPGRLAIERMANPNDSLVRDRIHDALRQGLARRGLAAEPLGTADLIVTYGAGAETKRELVETLGGGIEGNYGADNVWSRDVQQGTLVIDVLESGSDRLLWRSIAKGENQDFRSPEFIDRAVDKALSQFPANGRGAS